MRDAQGVVFFQAGCMALALYPREELAKDANVDPEGSGFVGMALAYNVHSRSEVDDILAQAQAAGARLWKPAQDGFWGGYSGYFADPDGFAWEVAWNPGFVLADNGSLRLPD